MDRILIFIFILNLLFIIFIDIKKKYIPNFSNFLLFLTVIFLKRDNSEFFFIGAGIYSLPIIFLYAYGSDIMNKEIIGFGDIKLIISLGGFLYSDKINIFLQTYLFYSATFLIATLFILLLFLQKFIHNYFSKTELNLKNKEIAFSPFIIFSFGINFMIFNQRGLLCLNELLAILKL